MAQNISNQNTFQVGEIWRYLSHFGLDKDFKGIRVNQAWIYKIKNINIEFILELSKQSFKCTIVNRAILS